MKRWYESASTHFFRTYFRTAGNNQATIFPEQQRCNRICEKVLAEIPQWQQEFLKRYYTTPWGKDREIIKVFSSETNLSEDALWAIIHAVGKRFFQIAGMIPEKSN